MVSFYQDDTSSDSSHTDERPQGRIFRRLGERERHEREELPPCFRLSQTRRTRNDPSDDVKPKLSGPNPVPVLLEEEDDFKSALLEYSKAIIKSGFDHSPHEDQGIIDDIVATREEVVAIYETQISKLKTDLSIKEAQNRQLHETITTQEEYRENLEGQLKDEKAKGVEAYRQMAVERDAKERYKELRVKNQLELKVTREECEGLEKEKSRKRQATVERWEKAENAKLDL